MKGRLTPGRGSSRFLPRRGWKGPYIGEHATIHPRRAAPPSDEDLLERMQGGDTDALGTLYARHHITALRVARAVCHDTDRSQEVVQEAFISIWRARATFQPHRGDAAGWTMRIVHNRAIAAARRNAAVERRREDLAVLPDQAAESDVAVEIERRELSASLKSAVSRLPVTQRDVITMAFFGGLTHTEIAAALMLPPGTVKGRARLGLVRLRRQIDAGQQ
ncbi:MAG: RNA polymerase sigma factor [Solirubrobacteraceae bacterium]